MVLLLIIINGGWFMKKVCLFAISAVAFSASLAVAALPSDAERIAATCAGCHGTFGASPGEYIPIIGGQKAWYLKSTMKEYRDGIRGGGVMVNLAKGYNDIQIEGVASFVSSWKWKNSDMRKKVAANQKVGKAISSCADCHGKKGEGTDIAPRIAGQAPGYLKDALVEYKNGVRKSSDMEIIKDASDKDIELYVKYYSKK